MGVRHAVVIGVNDYGPDSHLCPLKYAERDAEAVSCFLRKRGGFLVTLLTGSAAGRDAVVHALEGAARVSDSELFLFYVSGHGEEIGDGGHCVHCHGSTGPSRVHALSLHEIAGLVREVPAPQAVLIADACRGNRWTGARGRGHGAGLGLGTINALRNLSARERTIHAEHVDEPQPFPQLVHSLLACGAGQNSWEDDEGGHGVFTGALLRELETSSPDEPLEKLQKRVGQATYGHCVRRGLPIQIPEWISPSLPGDVYLLSRTDVSDSSIEREPTTTAARAFKVAPRRDQAAAAVSQPPPSTRLGDRVPHQPRGEFSAIRVDGASGSLHLRFRDEGATVFEGGCEKSTVEAGVWRIDRADGTLVVGDERPLSLDVRLLSGNVAGQVGIGGTIATHSGDVRLEVVRPMLVEAHTTSGRAHVEGMILAGDTWSPSDCRPGVCLAIRTLSGDIRVRYRPE